MVVSMTGFGRGEAVQDNIHAVVEIRSVNNRFLEVVSRLPRSLSGYELELKEFVRQRVSRGRVNVAVTLKSPEPGCLGIKLDLETARLYLQLLQKLRDSLQLEDSVKLDHILGFSEVFTSEESDDLAEKSWACVKIALEKAFEEFLQMKKDEGISLANDITARINKLNRYVDEIEEISKEHVKKEFSLLKQRVEEILTTSPVDAERLRLEIAILADRLDVTEECVRVRSHTRLFTELMASPQLVGRRLNFLLQEMNREANTMGAKSNNADISHRVVFMKEEIEKIREQVQNIE